MKVTIAQAQLLAETAIQEMIQGSPEFIGLAFSPVSYYRENEAYWVFGAACSELISQGYVPGAVIVGVDKNDGHIWQEEEYEQRAEEYERHRFSQPDTVAA